VTRLDFMTVVDEPDATLDRLALALAAEFRVVDVGGATAVLDALGAALRPWADADPAEQLEGCREVLGARAGFVGDREDFNAPENSMLDVVLERRSGLPILLATVWTEAARRAGIPLAGVGLPGHFVVGHFGPDPPLLADPFARGRAVTAAVPERFVRPSPVTSTVLRMCNNLVRSYTERADLMNAIHAARLRLVLPVEDALRDHLTTELRALQTHVV
jgi:regulator of sirC expression with transglutaminase-like and TPR domain